MDFSEILQTIDKFEKRMWRATQYAESRCTLIQLCANSDGSCSLVFHWTQQVPVHAGRSEIEQGFCNLMATINASPDMSQTVENFDSFKALEMYFRSNSLLN